MIYVLMDGSVTTIEASVLVGFYFVYVLVMYLNEDGMEKVDHLELDGKDGEEDDEDGGIISTAIALPLTAVFSISIPNCPSDDMKKWYIVTFTMSILWIG